jgi:hypothetical protein
MAPDSPVEDDAATSVATALACAVCMSRERSVACVPCVHRCLCEECVKREVDFAVKKSQVHFHQAFANGATQRTTFPIKRDPLLCTSKTKWPCCHHHQLPRQRNNQMQRTRKHCTCHVHE